jgi:hypothetical protein
LCNLLGIWIKLMSSCPAERNAERHLCGSAGETLLPVLPPGRIAGRCVPGMKRMPGSE